MIDGHQRNIEYLRISVTDRCNLRCIYCMPEDGVEQRCHEDILTYDEILHLVEAFAALGISQIKLTGGEPLVRKDLSQLVRGIKQTAGIENVTLTTNGLLLAGQLDDLVDAGLDAVNISIDSFDEDVFEKVTRRAGAVKVREAIEKALTYPDLRVKLNCVPMKEMNQASLLALAGMARDNRLSVRFIEMMPIGLGRQFEAFEEDELIALLEAEYGSFTPFKGKLGNGPCHYYTVNGFKGKIGFISAISHQFCESCNRIRLTSTGYLKTCLQYDHGKELKPYLQQGLSKGKLKDIIYETIYHKPEKHSFGEKNIEHAELKKMSQIGG